MTGQHAKSAALAAAGVVILSSVVGCSTTRPAAGTSVRAAATKANAAQSPPASLSAVPSSSPPAAAPSPSANKATSAPPAPTPARTKTTPTRSTTTLFAPPPVVHVGPAFAVSASSTPTVVSAPSTVDHWNICVPVTLHITNDTGAAITAVTVNPEIQSRSPGGQLDTLITTPDYYTVAHLNLGNGQSTSVHVNACGYIYNGASQTITYTGTAHMTGGYAAPGTPQQLPGPVGGMTVAISMS